MKATKKTVNAAAESKTAAVSTTAKTPAKAEVKPVVEKKAAAEKSAAEKKTAAKSAKPAAVKKTAAAKSPAAKKTTKTTKTTKAATAAKTTKTAKTAKAAKTAADKKAVPAKKPGRKAVVTIDSICTKIEKKISKTKASAIKEKVAVDIEVWGFEDGSKKMYIEINNGKATVSPHTYEAKDFRISLSVANVMAFVEGKTTLKALLESNEFYAEGNVAKAIKLASIF